MCKNVHSSTIHSIPKLEKKNNPNCHLDEQIVLNLYNEIHNSNRTKQSGGLISQTYCRVEEARHKKAHSVGLHLYKGANQAKLVDGDRHLDGGNLQGEGGGCKGSLKGFRDAS